MNSHFLGKIPFAQALRQERDAFQTVLAARLDGVILGFESEPVITFGVRAGEEDLLSNRSEIERAGFEICAVERGGQATIHNPGQLVIFPILNVREIGVKAWIARLAQVTRSALREFGTECEWREEQPGLYTTRGKIMACGVRIRQGVSTHGISINVSNRLEDFAFIRACGIQSAPLDRLGEDIPLASVFDVWCQKFREPGS